MYAVQVTASRYFPSDPFRCKFHGKYYNLLMHNLISPLDVIMSYAGLTRNPETLMRHHWLPAFAGMTV